MRYQRCAFNLSRGRQEYVRYLVAAVVIAAGAGCSRIGDDRFVKRPDAPPADAIDLTPDAPGPGDAPLAPDAAVAPLAPGP